MHQQHTDQPSNSLIVQRSSGGVVVQVTIHETVKSDGESVLDWPEIQRITTEYVENVLVDDSADE